MVKMKYLFLDLEWNQNGEFDAKTNEILEFAVASFSEEFVTGKRFARLVKPEHRILVLQELVQAIDSEKRLYGIEKYLKNLV